MRAGILPWSSWGNAEIYDRFVRERVIYGWLNRTLVRLADVSRGRTDPRPGMRHGRDHTRESRNDGIRAPNPGMHLDWRSLAPGWAARARRDEGVWRVQMTEE